MRNSLGMPILPASVMSVACRIMMHAQKLWVGSHQKDPRLLGQGQSCTSCMVDPRSSMVACALPICSEEEPSEEFSGGEPSWSATEEQDLSAQRLSQNPLKISKVSSFESQRSLRSVDSPKLISWKCCWSLRCSWARILDLMDRWMD